jgi:hypothetical protein
MEKPRNTPESGRVLAPGPLREKSALIRDKAVDLGLSPTGVCSTGFELYQYSGPSAIGKSRNAA